MPYKRILVPLDGSKKSEQALAEVIKLAAPGAAIQLLSVKGTDPATEVNLLARSVAAGSEAPKHWPPIEGISDPHAENAREKYLGKVQEWLSAAEFDVRVSIREGSVIDAIVHEAAHNDVVIMTTYRKSASAKRVMGSVVEAVIQSAPCPVLIVPGLQEEQA